MKTLSTRVTLEASVDLRCTELEARMLEYLAGFGARDIMTNLGTGNYSEAAWIDLLKSLRTQLGPEVRYLDKVQETIKVAGRA